MKKFKSIALITLVVIGMLFMVACTTTYTVSFDPAGGTPASYNSQNVAAGGLAKEPTPAPTRDGYKFTGWYAPSATTAWDFAKDKVSANVTLSAHWEKTVSTHKVTVSWKAYEGAVATDNYLIWLQTPLAGGWMVFDNATVSGDKTSYVFEIEDSMWKDNKIGAAVFYSSNGRLVATAQTDEADTVLFDGTKDITIPELTLVSVSSHKATVSWDSYSGAKASDKYLVWLAVYDEDTEVWYSLDEFMKVVTADQTSYTFELNDSIWKGRKFGAMVSLMSGGELVAAAQTNEKDVVLFDGTKDISIPKLTLVPANE